MVIKNQQWNKNLRGGVAGTVSAALALLCVLCVRLLIKPWRFDYGPEWYQPDYLQVFFGVLPLMSISSSLVIIFAGILVLLAFLPFATLMFSMCINIFFKNEDAILQSFDSKYAMLLMYFD